MATIHGQNTNDFDTLAGPFQVAVLHVAAAHLPICRAKNCAFAVRNRRSACIWEYFDPKCLRVSSVFGAFVTNSSTGNRSWVRSIRQDEKGARVSVHPIACDG